MAKQSAKEELEKIIDENMEEARKKAYAAILLMKKGDNRSAKSIELIFKSALVKMTREMKYMLSEKSLLKQGITMDEYINMITQIDALTASMSDLSSLSAPRLEAYKVAANLSRLEYVRAQIGIAITELYDEVEKLMLDKLTKEASAAIKQAGTSYNNGFVIDNAALNLAAVINADFYGAKWYERLFAHNNTLASRLYEIMSKALLLGQNPQTVAAKFGKEFGISARAARDLLITEASRVNAQAQEYQLTSMGFTEYEYIAELDEKTCAICSGLHGLHFKVADMQPGVNCHPMHSRCRCTVVGVWNEEILG